MIFEEALYAHLTADVAVAEYVAERVYQYTYPAPQGNEAFASCLVYQLKSEQSAGQGPDRGPVKAVYLIACVSADPGEPPLMAEAVKTALVGFQGEMGGVGGVRVNGIKRTDAGDEFDDQAGLFIRWLEFSVDYNL